MKKLKTLHICALNRNVGDNALNLAIRKMLGDFLDFHNCNIIGNKFNPKKVKEANGYDLIMLGGGGLIHSYSPSKANIRSGTNWQINLSDLNNIKKPIVLYGVGFNHFYGDPPPLPQMLKMFEILKRKKSLISFRNDGSIDRFKSYFPKFNYKLHEIPDPGLFFRPETKRQYKEDFIVIQLASDRFKKRYKGNYKRIINILKKIIETIELKALLIPHTIDDHKLYKSINLPNVDVFDFKKMLTDTDEVIGLYKHAKFSISTRGHSQICSIGNDTPTFSISTHPKVIGFAKECQLDEYVVNFPQDNDNLILHKFENFSNSIEKIKSKTNELNKRFEKDIKSFNNKFKNWFNSKITKECL